MTTKLTGRVLQCVGECMVEIVRTEVDSARLAYSGDTYNTAVYARRVSGLLAMPVEVRYLTGLGADRESAGMREHWRTEDIGDDSVTVEGKHPGLYLISTDDHGERSFSYWRADSAAANLFRGDDWVDRIAGDVVYLSGITLQLMSGRVRAALIERLAHLRARATVVVFDSNYRPTGWPDARTARNAMDVVLAHTDIALVTLDDEIALGGAPVVERVAGRMGAMGVAEVVVKVGPEGAWVHTEDELAHVPARPARAVDTTAAGDSFNGAYLAARMAGRPPLDAARVGNAVARAVVRHRGAIIPAYHLPALPL